MPGTKISTRRTCVHCSTMYTQLRHWGGRCLSLLIQIKDPHASRPRGARAREIHFLQILYSTVRRTSHHSGGPCVEFRYTCFFGYCGAFPSVCMLSHNSQNTKGVGSVFGILSPFLGVFLKPPQCIEVLNVKVTVFILLLFASIPDCGQNQTTVSDEQHSLYLTSIHDTTGVVQQ
jgi:hypothetical protein